MGSSAQRQGPRLALNAALLGLVIWTAAEVVETSHECREFYADLQTLQRAEWRMQDDWHRLLVEKGAQATYHGVETAAADLLDMRMPTAADVKRVRP